MGGLRKSNVKSQNPRSGTARQENSVNLRLRKTVYSEEHNFIR